MSVKKWHGMQNCMESVQQLSRQFSQCQRAGILLEYLKQVKKKGRDKDKVNIPSSF